MDLEQLKKDYEPRKVTIEEIENGYILTPFDYVEINSFEDLSKVGENLHLQKRKEKDELLEQLRIYHVSCEYNTYDEGVGRKDLNSTLVSFLPVQANQEPFNFLVNVLNEELDKDLEKFAK